MSIKLRLGLLLGLLLLGFGFSMMMLRALERRELQQMIADDQRSRSQLLNHWVDVTSRALAQYVTEAAQSEELAGWLAQGGTEPERKKIETSLASAGVDALWIVGANGTATAHFAATDREPIPALPLGGSEFTALVNETPSPRFFAETPAGLLEVCVRRWQVPAGRREWLMVARRWDATQLRTLADLTDSEASLGNPQDITQPLVPDSHIVLMRTLSDWRGHALRTLRVDYDASSLERTVQTDWQQAQVFLWFGLLLLTAVTLALQAWVLRPLGRIGESLARDDPQPVQTLSAEKNELGRIAQLVTTAFAQRSALKREIEERSRTQAALENSEITLRRTLEERARLGRDLHDGVIQSLYAAGMGLAGIRALLRPDQIEAAARMEQTRAALNETIHDVRNFIIGLEPEALRLQTFSQAVHALLDTMHGGRKFRSVVNIDETLAKQLSLSQRVHALQITREAVSNALRHGAATNVTVALRARDAFAEFEISDDGQGFDAAHPPESGQGLKNLAQRAQELGAELTVDSSPGRGARVLLVFSLQ